jgi:hypothetical protein
LAVFPDHNCLPQSKEKIILDNVFTLELAFGDKDLPDEYLLVRPFGVVINTNGDIIISDEARLKIYNTNGKPKRIVSRKGQGPGEFSATPFIYISEDGYLSAYDRGRPILNIFSLDYKFIEQINYLNSELSNKLKTDFNFEEFIISVIYPYNDKTNIVIGEWTIYKSPINKKTYFAIKTYGNECSFIYKFEKFSNPGELPLPDKVGIPLYVMLSNYRIAYIDAKEDKVLENGKWYYKITIINFKTGEKNEIKHQYTPVAIPDSIVHPKIDFTDRMSKERYKKLSDALEKLKYWGPLQWLASDGDYIFAYRCEYDKDKKYVADVFKSSENKYICSVYFPYIPYMFTDFKDGYAYRIKSSADEYPQLEKYRIDPKVYGK